MSALFPEPPGSAPRVPRAADPTPPPSANTPPTPPGLRQSNGSLDAARTQTDQAGWTTSAPQGRSSSATIAKTSLAPALPPAHNTRHTGAAASSDSDAEAARAAAASRQRNSLFHTREGAATESIPDVAIALGTMALPLGPSIAAQMAPRFAQRLLPKLLLPEYTGPTSGVLFTNEGRIVRLRSGAPDPAYRNYVSAKHAEGKAALWLRENDSSGGVLFHNHPEGTCGFCDLQARTLLPKNATLRVVPRADAVASDEMAKTQITNYMGDAKIPKPPKEELPSKRRR
jgi:SCP1.201-like deaminase